MAAAAAGLGLGVRLFEEGEKMEGEFYGTSRGGDYSCADITGVLVGHPRLKDRLIGAVAWVFLSSDRVQRVLSSCGRWSGIKY